MNLAGLLNIHPGPGFGPGTYALFDFGSIVNSGLTITSGSLGSLSGSIEVDTQHHQVDLVVSLATPAPEPASWMLMTCCVAALLAIPRRTRADKV